MAYNSGYASFCAEQKSKFKCGSAEKFPGKSGKNGSLWGWFLSIGAVLGSAMDVRGLSPVSNLVSPDCFIQPGPDPDF